MSVNTRLSAVVVATAGVLLLAACDSNVGTAAKVGDQSIGESQVTNYVTPQGTPFSANGQVIEPKQLVVTFLVRQAFAQQLLADTPGGVPNAGDLEQAESQALQQAGETRDQLQQSYTEKGFTAAAADLAIRSNTLLSVLSQRIGANANQFLQQHPVPVSIDPRYGNWDPTNLAVGGTAGDQLQFLKLQGSYAPQAASQ